MAIVPYNDSTLGLTPGPSNSPNILDKLANLDDTQTRSKVVCPAQNSSEKLKVGLHRP